MIIIFQISKNFTLTPQIMYFGPIRTYNWLWFSVNVFQFSDFDHLNREFMTDVTDQLMRRGWAPEVFKNGN
jgi:hypothetical protein